MKSHPTHPDISEFDRIDHLPTLAEMVAAARECLRSVLDAASLTWR